MFRILLSAGIAVATWFEFLGWAKTETEGQISKMQEAAFDTPGTEAPVPTSVLLAAFGVIAGHFTIGRMLHLRRLESATSLVVAVAIASILLLRPSRTY